MKHPPNVINNAIKKKIAVPNHPNKTYKPYPNANNPKKPINAKTIPIMFNSFIISP